MTRQGSILEHFSAALALIPYLVEFVIPFRSPAMLPLGARSWPSSRTVIGYRTVMIRIGRAPYDSLRDRVC